MSPRLAILVLLAVFASVPLGADARTVYRCVRDNTVSLSTAPEPGSKCTKKEIQDTAGKVPNLWGESVSYTHLTLPTNREV